MPDDAPQVPPQAATSPKGEDATEANIAKAEPPSAPASGRRPSFRDIRRQLNEEELRQPGVQKLLIEDFEKAETECEALRSYIEMYHEKDKEVARLSEKLKTNIAFEIMAGAGLTGGGAIVSLAPSIWDPKDTWKGIAALGVGFLFIIGSTIAKILQVKR